MIRPSLLDDVLREIRELTTIRPHEPPGRTGFTAEQWPAYREGYWMGVTMALKVADQRIKMDTLNRRMRRQMAKAKLLSA